MANLNLVQFVKFLNRRYDLDLTDKNITSIVSSLRDAGFGNSLTSDKDILLVKDLVVGTLSKSLKRQDPLKLSASVKVKSNFRSCPICNAMMEEVLIANNFPAYYCKEHKVTLPKERDDFNLLRKV